MWRELKLFGVVVAVVVMFMASFFYVKVVLKGPPKDVVPVNLYEHCKLYEQQCAGDGVWKIEEDDPAWDCHTMGNGVCGNE